MVSNLKTCEAKRKWWRSLAKAVGSAPDQWPPNLRPRSRAAPRPAKVLSSHLLSECRIKGEQRGRKEKGGKHKETGTPPKVCPQLWAAQVSLASSWEARQKGFPLYLHQLLEGVVTGPQLGHSKSCGDTQRRQENVVLVILGVGQVLIEGGGKARIGSGQLPDAPVGGLGDLLLRALLLHRLLLRRAVNAQGVHGDVPRLGCADVLHGAPVTGHTAPEPGEQQGQKTCPPIGGQKAELSLAGRTLIPAARPRRARERARLQPWECGQAAGPTQDRSVGRGQVDPPAPHGQVEIKIND